MKSKLARAAELEAEQVARDRAARDAWEHERSVASSGEQAAAAADDLLAVQAAHLGALRTELAETRGAFEILQTRVLEVERAMYKRR